VKNKLKICIAGAVETADCGLDVLDKAKDLGRHIAKLGHIVITGSHHGFPLFSAMGAKEAHGEVIYFSPASNLKEHVEGYRLDDQEADIIIYTGFGYAGSQVFNTRSADAVIIGFGKLDALHEFTLAVKEGKPIGVLRGDWDIDDVIKKLAGEKGASHLPIIFEEDPKKLVAKLLELVK
jgi:uncharacterized protein (TIGR00725 family)